VAAAAAAATSAAVAASESDSGTERGAKRHQGAEEASGGDGDGDDEGDSAGVDGVDPDAGFKRGKCRATSTSAWPHGAGKRCMLKLKHGGAHAYAR
jgi:hypothetical protein